MHYNMNMNTNTTSSAATDNVLYAMDQTLLNVEQQQQHSSTAEVSDTLLLQAPEWHEPSFGTVSDDYSFGSSILPSNPPMVVDVPATHSPLSSKVPELMPKEKLSINTTAIRRAATSPNLLQVPTTHTPLSGFSGHAGGQTPTTPIRRRTNYTTYDMGPAFAPTKQLVQATSTDRSREYVS